MKHLSIEEKLKRVELALKYIKAGDELRKLEREVQVLKKQVKCLKIKNNRSEEYYNCRNLFNAQKRKKAGLLKKYEKISTKFSLECQLDFHLDEIEKREIAHEILFKNEFLYLDVQGGWARKTFSRML